MYSLIRSLIGPNEARIEIHDQRRRQDDEDERQAVDAELVLDAEQRDPVGLDDVLEQSAAVGVAEKPTTSRSENDPRDAAPRRARAAGRSGPATRRRAIAPDAAAGT